MAFKLPKAIGALQFGLLSPDDVRKMSVVRVITADTYDEDGTNRRENITDWALAQFQEQYKAKKITKWDIFYYV